MNIQKSSKTASIVNYIKPGLEMVEMETEGSLLLTASGGGAPGMGAGGGDEGSTIGDNGTQYPGGDFSVSKPRVRRR